MKVWCAAFECIHNKNNLCKAKEINLSDSYVNTLYEGQMHCQKCRMHEEDEETKQIKKNIEEWSQKNSVRFIQDHTNFESEHARNIIRNDLIPVAKLVNPGLETTIRKMILNKYKAPK